MLNGEKKIEKTTNKIRRKEKRRKGLKKKRLDSTQKIEENS